VRTLKNDERALIAIMFVLLVIVIWMLYKESGRHGLFAELWAARARKIIASEVAGMKDSGWSGSYYLGNGYESESFSLAPGSGFVYEWWSDTGLVDRNFGSVTSGITSLSFNRFYKDEHHKYGGLPVELMPVRWGERMYLLPPNELVRFCNLINSGREPREKQRGSVFLREGDEEKSASGLPDLPTSLSKYLLQEPIGATILTAERPVFLKNDGWEYWSTTVTLSDGTGEGVLPGMAFHVRDPDILEFWPIKATACSDHISTAVMNDPDTTPSVGWKVSTWDRNKPFTKVPAPNRSGD
jgi:hypothetical protein